MKHVVDNVSDAWSDVSEETLKRSWNKLWPPETDVSNNDDFEIPTEEIMRIAMTGLEIERDDVNEWLESDLNDPGYRLLTDDEIIADVIEEEEDSGVETDAEYDGSDVPVVATPAIDLRLQATQAACNMQKFIEWYEQQEEANSVDTMLLRRLRRFATTKAEPKVKQTKLTNFFSKE